MRKFLKYSLAVIAAYAIIVTASADIPARDEYRQVTGLIHMDSEVSGGENSLAMLAAAARNAGAEVAVVTDHDTQKVTYGVWPLRKIIKFSHSRASVRKYGISKYIKEIADIDKNMSDFVYIPGIESVPYYRWERLPVTNELRLRNLHRHILVMGIDSAEQLKKLPSIEAGYPSKVTRKSLIGILWMVPLIIAFALFRLPRKDTIYDRKYIFRLLSHPNNFIALPLIVISVMFLFNSMPFTEQIVDQYGPDQGAKPYQTLIDYINQEGGLTFWAHPEAEYKEYITSEHGNKLVTTLLKTVLGGRLEVSTDPYYELLNDTTDYTGFAIFFEGNKIVGKPEGLWDSLLMQFCSGNRKRPVWAISEIDMESGTDPATASEAQTVFLVKEKTREAYLDALRLGRMYCFTAYLTRWATIRDYSVMAGSKHAISGEVIKYSPDATLTFDIEMRGKPRNLDIIVVRDGKIFSHEQADTTRKIKLQLPKPKNNMSYVRVAVYYGKDMCIATNPIFMVK